MRWILAPLAALAAVFAFASPALAGAWATTALDPLPSRLESDQSYTVGFWILQHGSHVSHPALTDPGLRLVDEQGKSVNVKGVPLPEGGHYAGAFAIPHDGTWTVWGTQAPWMDYEVGTLTIPGTLSLAPSPIPPLAATPDASWSTVKPPSVVAQLAPIRAAPARSANPAKAPAGTSPGTPWAPFGSGLFAGLVLAAVSYRLLTRRRGPRVSNSKSLLPAD